MGIEMNSMGTAEEVFTIKILICMSMAQEMQGR